MRSFSNLYRPYHTTNPGARTAPFTPQGRPTPGQYGPGFRGPGVDSAYRVVNKFMPQGSHSSAGQYGPQGYGPTYQPGMADGLQRMVANAISSYGGMASMMMEILNCMYGSGGYGGSGGYSGYGSGYCGEWNSPYSNPLPGEFPDTYLCTWIRVVLQSDRPCEVILGLQPHTDPEKLDTTDLDLISFDSSKKLNGIASFAAATSGDADQRRILTVKVEKDPTKAPSGPYQAKVLDGNKQQCGTLTLCLG